MAKVRPIRLVDEVAYVRDGDGFKEERRGERVIPAHLTMHALHFGEKEGLFKESILMRAADEMDEFKAIKLIYIACEGAQPGFHKEYPLEEFVQKLDVEMTEVLYIAESLIIDSLPDAKSEFIASMEDVTKKDAGEKK